MYENIEVRREGSLQIIQLRRDKAMNALTHQLTSELVDALWAADADDSVRCNVIVGNDRAFSAGADIKEMADESAVDWYVQNRFAAWDRLRRVTKPIVAGVSGYALGGGCELVLCCDVVVASEGATFGLPEINLGVIPGAGGTQRLTRSAGKALAMDMVLTGRFLSASEALDCGLVSRVVAAEAWLEETLQVARTIAARSPIATRAAKEAVLAAFETTLPTGLDYERKLFYLMFASRDQKEGMQAFVEKREPEFVGQ